MAERVSLGSGTDQSTMRTPMAATPPLPLPTKGPFSLDLDDLFAQAEAAVRSRDDIVNEFETLQDPPDLSDIIAGQQEILRMTVLSQVARCVKAAARLHELLVAQLAAEPARLEELNGFVDGGISLQEAIQRFSEGTPESAYELRHYRMHIERRLNLVVLEQAKPHEDPAAVLDVELAAARRLLTEIENRQAALLDTVLPRAREQMEFRALATEWEVQRRDIVQSLESAMLSVTLTELNTVLTEETAPRMRVKSFDGLRQSLTTDRIVITDAYELLDGMIRQRDEGSFGIAGPRGVGKSTLVRFFATTPGAHSPTEDEQYEMALYRPRLGVVVSAPVAYEPRDFVLHLYAELCKRVIGDDGDAAIRRGRELDREPDFYGVPLRRAHGGLAALGAGALTGGLGLLALAVSHRLPWAWHPIADIGAALVSLAMAILIVVLLRVAGLRPVFDRGIRVRVLRGGSTWLVAMISAAAVAGLTLLLAGGGWQGGTWLFLAGEILLAVSFTAGQAARMAWLISRLSVPVEETIEDVRTVVSPDRRLRELAFDRLRQIRYQQSFSRERSMGVKIGGGGALPVGVDTAGKRGETWQAMPKTYPELVEDLRSFLAAAAERHVLVVGVDELDKLRSYEEVEDFLNDIKGIFGTSGCFFLVSVSEDAAAGFERRGAPFRDVFDSAFDDVVSVRHLDLTCSRKVVYGLLLGWTKPFVGLCYVLSGGLARDLRRSARELISQRNSNDEIELGAATLAMCRRESEARIQAIRHELMREPFNPTNVDLLTHIADLAPTAATATTLRQWHEDLSSWITTMQPAVPIPTAARLGLELGAFMLFAATVIEFFDPAATSDRIREAENPDAGAKCLSTLAMARRSLALSPGISLAYTQRFRTAWGLAS